MTPLNYSHLKEQGFTMLLPIISQNNAAEEALTMWGKEWDNRVIRLEHHRLQNGREADSKKEDSAPFHPEGLQVFIGEKNAVELQYETTIFYGEELEALLIPES